MRISEFLRGACTASALFVTLAGAAGTSALCADASPFVSLDGPDAGGHRLVGSKVDLAASACRTGLTIGCAYTVLTLRAGTQHDGAWVTGPTTLAVGVPYGNGAPALAAASHALVERGEVHVGATSGYGCQGLRFVAQSAPRSTAATVLSVGGSANGLEYFVVDQDVTLSAAGEVDLEYSKLKAPQFDWDLGDGRQASGATATVRFPVAGEHFPTVTVSDGKFASAPRQVALWVRGPAQPPSTIASFRDCETGVVEVYWERTGLSFELEVYESGAWRRRYAGPEPYAAFSGTLQGKTVRVRAFDPMFGSAPSGWTTHQVPRIGCPDVDPDL